MANDDNLLDLIEKMADSTYLKGIKLLILDFIKVTILCILVFAFVIFANGIFIQGLEISYVQTGLILLGCLFLVGTALTYTLIFVWYTLSKIWTHLNNSF